ncbi:MAG: hypothetical protein GY765_21260 [bacterium]|nr:hypothetical protein [bacterium]
MHDVDAFIAARIAFAKIGNLRKVEKSIKKKWGVPYITLSRWYRENRDEWDHAAVEYIRQAAEIKATVEDFFDSTFLELKEIKDSLSRKLRENLEGGGGIDAQALYAFKSIISEMMALAQASSKKEGGDVYAQALVEVLFAHPAIGPLFVDHQEEIEDKIKAKIARLKKKK